MTAEQTNLTRIVEFTPQRWVNDYAVSAGPTFTFEVTTALAELHRDNPTLAQEVEEAYGWHDLFDNFYEDALESGQIDERWDGPYEMRLIEADDSDVYGEVTYPELPTTPVIVKTTFTFEVLHRADLTFEDILHALEEADTGHAVGSVTQTVRVGIRNENVPGELAALGNDGSFFDDDLDEATQED